MSLGCGHTAYVPPESPMPANTVMLSQMMRELSSQPGFTEALLKELDKGGKKGPALLTPELADDLRKRILGKDWSGLDRFPGWTMRRINPTVRVVGHFAGKDEILEDASKVHPGASPSTAQMNEYLDLGPFAQQQGGSISLEHPSTLPGFTTDHIVSQLGEDVVRGDGPNQLAAEHSESQRLADVLNRLALNGMDGVPRANALWNAERTPSTPERLLRDIIETGQTVTVTDSRYFANFGHFHYKGQDVMMPFWVDSQIIIPDSGRRSLLVPVSHAELEWHIRGPLLNADISWYFGIDGKAEWRVMDTLDQAWVLKRDAHTYTGEQAIEVTRLTGLMTAAYMRLHAAHPSLPFGGYYALGVCQDTVSAIEKKMTGKVTLFPNTADASFFNNPKDAEVNALMAAIPKDRSGAPPEPERIFGSLPTEPGADGRFSAITIPGLASDLARTYSAWQNGTLKRRHSRLNSWLLYAAIGVVAVIGIAAMRRRNIEDF